MTQRDGEQGTPPVSIHRCAGAALCVTPISEDNCVMERPDLIHRTADYVKAILSGERSGHDWWHTYRVWRTAQWIGQAEGADLGEVDSRGTSRERFGADGILSVRQQWTTNRRFLS